MNFDWKQVVKSVAPTLGTALLGPMGGSAVKFLADNFLGDPNASEEKIADAVEHATPEQINKLKELELKFIEYALEGLKLDNADRSSARARQVAMAEEGHRDYMPEFLTISMTLGFFACLLVIGLDQDGIPETTRELFFMMIGALISQLSSIKDYYFGSSSGSRIKDFNLKK